MKIIKRILCVSILLVAFNGASAKDDELTRKLKFAVDDSLLNNTQIGISIYDVTADKALFRHNDTLLFKPASNMKLFTSAAALELLGPSFRFKTQIKIRGRITEKKLEGDLVIVGGGDPLISGRFRSNITEILEFWADSLIAHGIEEIDGGIVIDNSYFEGPNLGAGWSWDDLTYWYACPISALSFNDNCIDLKFMPGPIIGEPAIIECNPNTNYIISHNMTYTLPAESTFTLDFYRIPYTNDVTFFGGIPSSDTAGEVDYVSVHRPEIYTAMVFSSVMASKGIIFKGTAVSLDDIEMSRQAEYSHPALIPLFTWHSDTLGVVAQVINTNSQNFFAEQTLLTLGAEKQGEGSFKAGILAAREFFDGIGISRKDLAMLDGSGLSYINVVKPKAIITLLRYMTKSPNFDLYFESLGNPAEDRSVRNRLKDQPGRENIRAKTGHIAGVSTFSGYVKGPHSNHLIAFSIMVNNYTCPRDYSETWEDGIVALLLRDY
jgi:D-alanyl-D-alanine carboxypeptidase/D-alanyl-D-alanine-endopeptidase (penicillin-binding protein 4)